MFLKSYNLWHKLKLFLNNEKQRVYFHEKEIWFCHLGENVGFEQDGRGMSFLRPVLILKKFNNQVFWAIPLTKTIKNGDYYYSFCFNKKLKSTAILSQIRLIDAKRLKYKSGGLQTAEFTEIKEKIKHLLD